MVQEPTPPDPLPDGDVSGLDTVQLVRRVQRGDREAKEQLFARHYPRVRRIVRVRLGVKLGAREEVEDVVQRVMERALADFDDYELREDARFIDWLARIAQHEIASLHRHHAAQKRDAGREQALDALRPRGDASADGFEPTDEGTAVLDRLSRQELEAIVDQCLAELPEDAREVILLRDYAGGSWAYIAETLGRPSADAARQFHARSLATLGSLVQRRTGGRTFG